MIWKSTLASVNDRKISFLAILESIVAVSISIWLAIEYETIIHVIISSIIAPFLLLRTEDSIRRGLKYFTHISLKAYENSGKKVALLGGVLAISIPVYYYFGFFFTLLVPVYLLISSVVASRSIKTKSSSFLALIIITIMLAPIVAVGFVPLMLASIISKFLAISWTFINSPISSLRAIPTNWFHIVFCIDSFYPPELITGIENDKYHSSGLKFLRFSNFTKRSVYSITDVEPIFKASLAIGITAGLIIFIPALIYRWSLKSSSIVWLPLIWIVGSEEKDNNQSVQIKLEIMRNSAWAKVTAVYSFVVIFLFTILPLVLIVRARALTQEINTLGNESLFGFLGDYLFAFQMHAWHWSRLLVAIITLFSFFYADKMLITRKYKEQAGLTYTNSLLRLINLVRWPLSAFTIGCGFYLLIARINLNEQFQNMQWLPFT